MNKTELQTELATLLKRVVDLETKIEEMPDEVVGCMPMTKEPDVGQRYYYICEGYSVSSFYWSDDCFDNDCFSIGNCYATKETAERELQHKKLQFREYQAAMQSWGGEQIDWKNPKQNKYFSFYEHLQEKVSVGTRTTAQTANVNYFYTETRLQTFIDSLTKDEQKLLWAGE